jgi:hypothetical protein
MPARSITFCVVLAAAWACSAPVPTNPSPTPTPTPTPTPVPQTRLQMSGRVFDDNGAVVPDALVAVDYLSTTRASTPPSSCPSGGPLPFCWLATRTNDRGEYAVEFEPLPWPQRGLGFVYSFREGYETDVQWVPVGPNPAVRDMKIQASRPIKAGDGAVVTVGSTSSLCTDLEDLWVLDHRCEIVVINAGAGTLTIDARPVSGSATPQVFWYTSGNYAGLITRPAPGSVSIPVRGGTYRLLIARPDGTPVQQFNVTTSLQ